VANGARKKSRSPFEEKSKFSGGGGYPFGASDSPRAARVEQLIIGESLYWGVASWIRRKKANAC